jgi:transcriptional regulator
MDRRTMLAVLGAAPGLLGADARAQESTPSLYIPQAHLVDDRNFLHDFMEQFSFVELITPQPTLRITHIPTVLDRGAGKYGTVLAHISAQNPQRAALDGAHQAVIVFRGPHGYISPTWYAKNDVVPTWNFAVVHASGRPKAITDHDEAHALLARLIKKNEATVGSTTYDFEKLPAEYVNGLMRGIVPFTMEIEAIEGKFKLGQERSEGDRQGVLAHLRQDAYRERSLHELTEALYRMRPK